jgi:hypothetical protein
MTLSLFLWMPHARLQARESLQEMLKDDSCLLLCA